MLPETFRLPVTELIVVTIPVNKAPLPLKKLAVTLPVVNTFEFKLILLAVIFTLLAAFNAKSVVEDTTPAPVLDELAIKVVAITLPVTVKLPVTELIFAEVATTPVNLEPSPTK